MHYNIKQLYTPPLEIYEFNERALIIDTETIGSGPTVEIIEIAIGDVAGNVVYETLVHPTFHPLPMPSKIHRFGKSEFINAPYWTDIWPKISSLIDGKLLVAYNAAFDRRALAATCFRHQQTSSERGWRCALQLVKKAMGIRKSPTLNEACAYFGLAGGNHRAGRDVQATYHLLKALAAPRV